MQPARLKLYYNYLGDFDFADKELRTVNSLIIKPKSNVLNITFNFNNNHSNKNIIAKSLVSEVFGNQRFSIRRIKKTFFKNLFFGLTLRKENLFLFLDNSLNTIFLHDYKSLALNNIRLENKLHFYFCNELTNHFILITTKLDFYIHLPNLIISSNKNLINRFFCPAS